MNKFLDYLWYVLEVVNPTPPPLPMRPISNGVFLQNKIAQLRGLVLPGLSYEDYDLRGFLYTTSFDVLFADLQVHGLAMKYRREDLENLPSVLEPSRLSFIELVKQSVRIKTIEDGLVEAILDEFDRFLQQFEALPTDEQYRHGRYCNYLFSDIATILTFLEKKDSRTHFYKDAAH